MIDFAKLDISMHDNTMINSIATRYIANCVHLNKAPVNRLELEMDITACHAIGCPLRLVDLLNAPEFDFMHDVSGIRAYLDRTTGMLREFFVPRYADNNAPKLPCCGKINHPAELTCPKCFQDYTNVELQGCPDDPNQCCSSCFEEGGE